MWAVAPHPRPCGEAQSHLPGPPAPTPRAEREGGLPEAAVPWQPSSAEDGEGARPLSDWSVCSWGPEPVPEAVPHAGSAESRPSVRPASGGSHGGASLTCMSSTFPKNRPTGIGWLLSSSRKTLSSVCSAAPPRAVRLPWGSSPVRGPCAGGDGPSSVSAGRESPTAVPCPRGPPVAAGSVGAPAPLPGGAVGSSANPRGSLSQGRSGGILGRAALSLLGTRFCNSDFTR